MGSSKGSASPVTIGYDYYMSMHMVLCQSVDSIQEIRTYDDVIISDTPILSTGVVDLKGKADLYGGKFKEGGVEGELIVLLDGLPKGEVSSIPSNTVERTIEIVPGFPFKTNMPETVQWKEGQGFVYPDGSLFTPQAVTKTLRERLISIFTGTNVKNIVGSSPVLFNQAAIKSNFKGENLPAFKGVTSVIWDDLKYQSNTSRPKAWKFKVTRIPYRTHPTLGAYAVIPYEGIPQLFNVYTKDADVVGTTITKAGQAIFLNGVELHDIKISSSPGDVDSAEDVQPLTAGKIGYLVSFTKPGTTDTVYSGMAYQGIIPPSVFLGPNLYYTARVTPAKITAATATTPEIIVPETTIWEVEKLVGAAAGPYLHGSTKSLVDGKIYPPVVTTVGSTGAATVSIQEANPALVILECITNTTWGLGFPETEVNLNDFKIAADRLKNKEQFGISASWENDSTVEEFLSMILQTINGVLYIEPTTGQFTLKLLRKEDIASSVVLNEDNVIEVRKFSRSGVSELVNQVSVQYIDAVLGTTKSVTVHNSAAREIQKHTVSTSRSYQMVSRDKLAATLAARDLTLLSQSIATVELVTNRDASTLRIGDVVDWSWADFGITNMSLRVMSIGFGLLEDGRITLHCVENVFKTDQVSYGVMTGEEFTSPLEQFTPQMVSRLKSFNLHYWDIQRLKTFPGDNIDVSNVDADSGVIALFAQAPDAQASQFEAKLSLTEDGTYTTTGVLSFIPACTTKSVMVPEVTTVIEVQNATGLNTVKVGSYLVCSQNQNGKEVEEVMELVSFAPDFSAVKVKRGVFHTTPKTFNSDATLWFYSDLLQKCVIDREIPSYTEVWLKAIAIGKNRTPSVNDVRLRATVKSVWAEPYPVADLKAVSDDLGQVVITWKHRDAFTQQDKIVGQDAGDLLARTAGIYNAVRIFDQAGNIKLNLDQYAGDTTETPGKVTNRFIYHRGNSDELLYIAVCSVQGDKHSEWAKTEIKIVPTAMGVGFPAFAEFYPEALNVAPFLTPSVTLVDGVFNTTYGWTEFDGSTVKLRLESDSEKVFKEKARFFSASEKSIWFRRYKIELLDAQYPYNAKTKLDTTTQSVVPIVYHSSSPVFEYTKDLNLLDNGEAQRFLRFRVSIEDTAGGFSASKSITVANPAPLISSFSPTFYVNPTSVDIEISYGLSRLDHTSAILTNGVANPLYKPEQVLVYGVTQASLMGATTFTPASTNLLLQSAEKTIKLRLPTKEKYYLIVKAVDTFGLESTKNSNAFLLDPTQESTTWSKSVWESLGFQGDLLGNNIGTHICAVVKAINTSLPLTGNIKGDVRLKSEDTAPLNAYPVYTWDGTQWKALPNTLDMAEVNILSLADFKVYNLSYLKDAILQPTEEQLKEGDILYDPVTNSNWLWKNSKLSLFNSGDLAAGLSNIGVKVEDIATVTYDYYAKNNNLTTPVTAVSGLHYEAQVQAVGNGNATVAVRWSYSGSSNGDAPIDGFLVEFNVAETAAAPDFSKPKGVGSLVKFRWGAKVEDQQVDYVYYHTDVANKFFSFAVWAYRDISANSNPSKLKTLYSTSAIIAPFQPATTLKFMGVDAQKLEVSIRDMSDDLVIEAVEKGLTFRRWLARLDLSNSFSEFNLALSLATSDKLSAFKENLRIARKDVITTLTETYYPIKDTNYESYLYAGDTKRHKITKEVSPSGGNKSLTHSLISKSQFDDVFLAYETALSDLKYAKAQLAIGIDVTSEAALTISITGLKTLGDAYGVAEINKDKILLAPSTDTATRTAVTLVWTNLYQAVTTTNGFAIYSDGTTSPAPSDTLISAYTEKTAFRFKSATEKVTLYAAFSAFDTALAAAQSALKAAEESFTAGIDALATDSIDEMFHLRRVLNQYSSNMSDIKKKWAEISERKVAVEEKYTAYSLTHSSAYVTTYSTLTAQVNFQRSISLGTVIIEKTDSAWDTSIANYSSPKGDLIFSNLSEATDLYNAIKGFVIELRFAESAVSAAAAAQAVTLATATPTINSLVVVNSPDTLVTPPVVTGPTIKLLGNTKTALDIKVDWTLPADISKIDGYYVMLSSGFSENVSVATTFESRLTNGMVEEQKSSFTFNHQSNTLHYGATIFSVKQITTTAYNTASAAQRAKCIKIAGSWYISSVGVVTAAKCVAYAATHTKSATAPTIKTQGDYWFNTTTFIISKFNGSDWVALTVAEANDYRLINPIIVSQDTEPPNLPGFYWENTRAFLTGGVLPKAKVYWDDGNGLWVGTGMVLIKTVTNKAVSNYLPVEGSIVLVTTNNTLYKAQDGWKRVIQFASNSYFGTALPLYTASTLLRYFDTNTFKYYTRTATIEKWREYDLFTKTPLKTAVLPKTTTI